MIEEIEAGIIDRIKDKWQRHGGITKVSTFDIASDFDTLLNPPAISVATETIGIRRIADGWELKPRISIYLAFKNVRSEKGRRQGVYPMILGTIGILAGHDLDLEIDDLMPVGQAQEIYHEQLKQKGLIVWRVNFETSFDILRMDDDSEAVRLISEGLHYFVNNSESQNANDEISYE